MSLRDGMHSIGHQFTLQNMLDLSQALDDAKVDLIEVTHGDGLGAHRLTMALVCTLIRSI